jgi:putative aldouronate transport system substrate-binding protein
MKSKKMVVMLSGLLAVVTMFTACSSTSSSPSTALPADSANPKSEELIPVRIIAIDAAPTEFPAVQKAINDKMRQDGLNLDLQITFIPRDVLNQKVNIMFASGDPIELMAVMENVQSSSIYQSRGMLTPLNDLIDKYGPELKKRFSDSTWKSSEINGKIYSIPADWKSLTMSGGEVGRFSLRTDLFKKYNIPLPTTAAELLKAAEEIKEKSGDKNLLIWPSARSYTPVYLHRSYDTWPFDVDFGTELFKVDQQGNVTPWLESAEFKKDSAFYREAYQKGLLYPDYLSLPSEEEKKLSGNGNYIFGGGVPKDVLKTIPSFTQENYQLNPDKPVLLTVPVLNTHVVPVTTKHPEAGIKFLNWLYSKQENHDLLMFGILGSHYTVDKGIMINQMKDSSGKPLYSYPFWQLGYKEWSRFPVGTDQDKIDRAMQEAKNVIPSVALGFNFDPTPVSTEYKNVLALVPSVIYPIKFGMQDYDQFFPKAIEKLKVAGYEKVVAEYSKQLKAWRQTQK